MWGCSGSWDLLASGSTHLACGGARALPPPRPGTVPAPSRVPAPCWERESERAAGGGGVGGAWGGRGAALGCADNAEGREGIRRGLGTLRGARCQPQGFSQAEGKVLALGRGHPRRNFRVGGAGIQSSPRRRTWGCWVLGAEQEPGSGSA